MSKEENIILFDSDFSHTDKDVYVKVRIRTVDKAEKIKLKEIFSQPGIVG